MCPTKRGLPRIPILKVKGGLCECVVQKEIVLGGGMWITSYCFIVTCLFFDILLNKRRLSWTKRHLARICTAVWICVICYDLLKQMITYPILTLSPTTNPIICHTMIQYNICTYHIILLITSTLDGFT